MDIIAPNVVLKFQKIPTLGGGRRKQFYVILLQEEPEKAPNVVLKLQMLPTRGGGSDKVSKYAHLTVIKCLLGEGRGWAQFPHTFPGTPKVPLFT